MHLMLTAAAFIVVLVGTLTFLLAGLAFLLAVRRHDDEPPVNLTLHDAE